MVVGHWIPFRGLRHGHLSDSKGSSAAFAAEQAVVAVNRVADGFQGPQDIFNNPQAIFSMLYEDQQPFELELCHSGLGFAVRGFHTKLGLYEHQSAGAIQAVVDIVHEYPHVLDENIETIEIQIYGTAYGIICDPAKKRPKVRQTADHSMYWIVASLLHKAQENRYELYYGISKEEIWAMNMLTPTDFDFLDDPVILGLVDRIVVKHGGPEFDKNYPKGIPTSVTITTDRDTYESGMILYPFGHSRCRHYDFDYIFSEKMKRFGEYAFDSEEALQKYVKFARRVGTLKNLGLKRIYQVDINGLE